MWGCLVCVITGGFADESCVTSTRKKLIDSVVTCCAVCGMSDEISGTETIGPIVDLTIGISLADVCMK